MTHLPRTLRELAEQVGWCDANRPMPASVYRTIDAALHVAADHIDALETAGSVVADALDSMLHDESCNREGNRCDCGKYKALAIWNSRKKQPPDLAARG